MLLHTRYAFSSFRSILNPLQSPLPSHSHSPALSSFHLPHSHKYLYQLPSLSGSFLPHTLIPHSHSLSGSYSPILSLFHSWLPLISSHRCWLYHSLQLIPLPHHK